jgi:hypothetical protein
MEILSDGQDDGGRGRAGVLPRGKTRAWVRFSSWELWFSFVMFSDLRRGMRSRNGELEGSAVAIACAVPLRARPLSFSNECCRRPHYYCFAGTNSRVRAFVWRTSWRHHTQTQTKHWPSPTIFCSRQRPPRRVIALLGVDCHVNLVLMLPEDEDMISAATRWTPLTLDLKGKRIASYNETCTC